MGLTGTGTLFKYNGKCILYIPIIVSSDSAFPFKERKQKVLIKIKRGKLVVEPCK